uniref:Embryo defective 1703 n=1 Tax=Chenopodium quinoa TaxID=63459 RepID=A0A803KZN8_CHEQI
MEILTSSFLPKPQFSSSISFLCPSSSLRTLTKKTPYKFRKTHLKSFPNPPFSTNLPLQNTKKFHISARFGRPTKRRNSLRKKLTGDDGGNSQVRQNPQKIIDPAHNLVDNQVSDLKLSSDGLERTIDSEISNLGNSREFGESVLWNKLEGWVDQYKKDIEFWGIGSSPIFTVFQDGNGKVERVLVDEDEILKRSGVEPLYFRKESELEDFDEVKTKISYAKLLAKEVEGGKNVIPRNSSVAKFVVSGEESGFVSRIRSVIVQPKSITKVSRVGIAVVCGFVFVWMIKSVEVLEGPADTPTVLTERPRLDKDEVLNRIREAKGLTNGLVALDVTGAPKMASVDVDVRIQEIQMMARHAREIERGEGSASEGGELDGQLPNEEHLVEKDTVEVPENSIWTDEAEIQASNVLPYISEDALEEHAGGDMSNLLSKFFAEISTLNGIPGMEISGTPQEMQSDDSKSTSEDVYEGIEDVEPHNNSNGMIIGDTKSHISSPFQSHDISDLSNVTEGSQSFISRSQLHLPKKTPVRRKPKIIRSVKEAREYLLQKNDKRSEASDIPTTAASKDEGMDNSYSKRLEEDGEALKTFDADKKFDTIPAPKVMYDSAKGNEVFATDIDGVKLETESILNQNKAFDPPSVKISGTDTISDSCGRLDLMPGENDICDDSQEANKPLLTEQSLEKVETGVMPKPTDLSKISDPASGQNASHNGSKFTEAAGVRHKSALHDANLQEKVYLSNDNGNFNLNEVNETRNSSKPSEIIVPAGVGNYLNGSSSGSVKEEVQLGGINNENDYRKNHETAETLLGSGSSLESVDDREEALFADKENWLEKNFHEVEPIVKKIGSGFRENYNVAREKNNQEDTELDLMTLGCITDNTELEWMQDDKLKEIVFKVRENELAGRDPFHSMDPEDKVAFYAGLESKVEKENQKLAALHDWLHSNIENIDYGADGISLYDPPEKVIPKWKGPPLDTISDFLNNSRSQQQVTSSLQTENESKYMDSVEASQKASPSKSLPREKGAKVSKTVIEASDGSVKPGKKSGKEYWKHTKKWSRGFVESYNAETDPEVKSVMKDIGKDLDRWITKEEIQDAADLMDKIPQKGKEIIEKKLSKLRREMEMFGPQAVVSKYREYAEEKEEDYLWWLDLPHLLCIEMYTYEGEDQRVGFYSLEMGVDLELEPKPRHVIAFEDPSDCKNFCYIIQAHLEMLGKGKAFIVPQPPKDVFRQAKVNGFDVTVIRKGEIKLNVDQHLEEVEELIVEIGSKMYHDKIMRERSVDISSLMKGVLGVSPPTKRKRKKRARKRPSKK